MPKALNEETNEDGMDEDDDDDEDESGGENADIADDNDDAEKEEEEENDADEPRAEGTGLLKALEPEVRCLHSTTGPSGAAIGMKTM